MSALHDLITTVARLRGPGGCPWDQEQTHQSLCQHLIEETAELLDTIDRADLPHMREELGDVLLQVVLHSQIAADDGHFTIEDVAREINEKLIRRHPHVFGEVAVANADEVLVNWEAIKKLEKAEKGQSSPAVKTPPPRLPALLQARDAFKQLQKHPGVDGLAQLETSARAKAAGLQEEEAGRQLFELAAACRLAGIDPESALRRESSRRLQNLAESLTAP